MLTSTVKARWVLLASDLRAMCPWREGTALGFEPWEPAMAEVLKATR